MRDAFNGLSNCSWPILDLGHHPVEFDYFGSNYWGFYLVGGAKYEGRSYVLGLGYLAGLQPSEYIFAGAELILFYSSPFVFVILFLGLVIAVWIANGMPVVPTGHTLSFPRKGEYVFFFALTFIVTFGLVPLVIRTGVSARNLITTGSCPVTGHGTVTRAWLVCCGLSAFVGITVWLFHRRMLRFAFLLWGVSILSLCLFSFGWAAGAEQLYGTEFSVVEIVSPSLHLTSDSKALILGADANNLVLLIPGEGTHGHPEPRYISRSEVKTFRLVGSSSINNFFCKPVSRKP